MNWIICSDVKREARDSLRGRWGLAIGTFLIGGIIASIPNIISSFINNSERIMDGNVMLLIVCMSAIVFPIIRALLDVIIGYGYCDFSLNIAKNKNAEISDIFEGFKHFLKLLLVWLIKGIGFNLLLLPVYALCILLGIYSVASSLSYFRVYNNTDLSVLTGGAFAFIGVIFVISIITTVICIILDTLISQTYFILKENDSESITTCIKNSFKMMKGHIWNYIILNLSFIGWGILCLFTLGIGLLWLTPYTQITRAKFYLKVKEEYYSNKITINE